MVQVLGVHDRNRDGKQAYEQSAKRCERYPNTLRECTHSTHIQFPLRLPVGERIFNNWRLADKETYGANSCLLLGVPLMGCISLSLHKRATIGSQIGRAHV